MKYILIYHENLYDGYDQCKRLEFNSAEKLHENVNIILQDESNEIVFSGLVEKEFEYKKYLDFTPLEK